ncbi:MAG: hypothetical protein ACYSW7_01610 [Planctomycetota bacterium]|jgi:uncharacterized repeat protein (TIGR01451 family)
MKKLLNISLLLLVLGLSGPFGCKSIIGSRETEPEEPDLMERLFRDEGLFEDQEPQPTIAAPPVEETPTFFEVEPEPTPISQPTPHIISRTYPCAECGTIQLDKIMPKEVELNQPFDYSIIVTNLTNMMLTDVVINENLPDNFQFTGAIPTAQKNANNLRWEMYSFEPKASRQIIISGIAIDTGHLKHYTTAMANAVPACTSVEVVQPKLELTMTAPAKVLSCDPIPIIFVVSNSGTGSIRDVKIVDSLPAGLRASDGTSELVFDAGTLTAGQSRQFLAKLQPTTIGRYVNRVVASSATGLKASSAAATMIVGQPVLTIKRTGSERWYLGRLATYEITVTNTGDLPAKNTIIENVIPAGVTSVEATAEGKLSGSTLTWKMGILAPNASKTVSVSCMPTKEGPLTNIATVTAYCAEPATVTAKITAAGIPGVLLEVIDIEDPVNIGSLVTYVITVTNQGSAHSTNIRIVCVLEDNVRYVSSAGTSPGQIKGNTVRFAPLGILPPKAKATWRVIATAVEPGDVRCKITLNTDQLTRPVEETEATYLYE